MRIFIAICLAATSLYAQNLIRNGNFAERTADGKPAHWQVWPDNMPNGANLELDTTMSSSAGCSVRIMHTKTDMYSRVQQVVPCKPHTNYIAFFKSMGKEINSPYGGVVRMYIGPNGKLMSQLTSFGPAFEYYKLGRPQNWSYPWTQYQSKVFNSGDSEALGVCVYLAKARGIAWIDDIGIYEYTPELRKEIEAGQARRLMLQDVQALRSNASGFVDMRKRLDNFEARIAQWYPEPRSKAVDGMPFYKLQRELLELNAEILRRRHPGKGIIVTDAEALRPGKHIMDALPEAAKLIELAGLRGEMEAFALNFTNCNAKELEIALILPGDIAIECRLATAVEAEEGKVNDDALVLLASSEDGKVRFRIPSGMTRQLFCVATMPDKPGELSSTLKWQSEVESGEVQLAVNVSKAAMPEKMPLLTFGYLEHNNGSFWRRGATSKAIVKRIHQNAEMISHVTTLRGVFDGTGRIQPEKMDWRNVDNTLSMLPPEGKLIFNVLLTHDPYLTIFLGKANDQRIVPFSAEWESRASQYLRAVIEGFGKRGLGYDRFFFCLKDEPSTNELENMEKMAAFIRKFDSNVRIYNNCNNVLPMAGIRKLASFVDIISPHRGQLTPEILDACKGKELWCYWVQNKSVPGCDIHDFFLEMKLKNVHAFSYWCLCDNVNPWYSERQSYSVIYPGDDKEWIPSKRSEAIREGIEAYALLDLLEHQDKAYYQQIKDEINSSSWRELRQRILSRIK